MGTKAEVKMNRALRIVIAFIKRYLFFKDRIRKRPGKIIWHSALEI